MLDASCARSSKRSGSASRSSAEGAKLLGALGLWLGWQALPFLLLLASGFGLALALLRARAEPLARQRIPLGSALGMAAMLLGLMPGIV